MKNERKTAIKNSAIDSIAPATASIITPFITSNPVLTASLGLAAATFGAAVIYRQERFNQVVQHIIDNPNVYTDKILQSKEFRDGLVIHLDACFKLRGEEKLKLAQNIFYDFASSKNMPVYPLERYDDTLAKISDASIRFLGFIEADIPTIKEEYLYSRMRQHGNSFDEKNIANMRKAYIDNEPLSKFVDIHIENKVHEQMQRSENRTDTPLFREAEVKKSIALEIGLTVSELEQLGVINRFSFQTQGWSGGNAVSGYNLTHYGRMFTSVIKPDTADLRT